MAADGSAVEAKYDATMAGSAGRLLVYENTPLCFTLTAVNAEGNSSLYESVWAHYSVASPSGAAITSAAHNNTPYVYHYMERSTVEFCFTVTGNEGSDFVVNFIAQSFGQNWAFLAGGQCQTTTFTLKKSKYVAGIKTSSVSGLTFMAPYVAGTSHIWGYKQLELAADTVDLQTFWTVTDHYGNDIALSDVATAHQGMALVVGTCTKNNMDLSTCTQVTSAGASGITVASPHQPEEGGALRVVVSGTTHKLTESLLSINLRLSQWCLHCVITFGLADSSGAFTDLAVGAVTAKATISILAPKSLMSYVAFGKANSPMHHPFLNRTGLLHSHWPHIMPPAHGGAFELPPARNASAALIHRDCFNASSPCPVPDTFLAHSQCDSRTTRLTGYGDAPMQFLLSRSTVEMQWGEPWCSSSCEYSDGGVQSQVDIFNNYTVSVSVGSVLLSCVGGGCTGEGTATVTKTVLALGDTMEAAILAAAGPLPRAEFVIEGVAPSADYLQNYTDNVIPAGTVPTVAGMLTVNATYENPTAATQGATSGNITNLASMSGPVNETDVYWIAWRGPQQPTQVAVVDIAQDTCNTVTTYDAFVAAPAVYTGYVEQHSLANIRFNYASETIPVNVYVPVTVEVQDHLGHRSPVLSGTMTAMLVAWPGCNNGGTMTVDGGDTFAFSGGVATVKVKFSAPCERCRVRFNVTGSSTQSTLFAQLEANSNARQAESKPFNVKDYIAASAKTVFATSAAASQPATVSLASGIAVAVQAYTNYGNFTVMDTTSTVELSVSNYMRSDRGEKLWTTGNGGILRQSATGINLQNRHGNRVTSSAGAAGMTVHFQRTCEACQILVEWRIPETKASGSFLLKNADGTTNFRVVGLTAIKSFMGHAPHIVRKREPFTASIWNAVSEGNIPWAGYVPASIPTVDVPTMTVIDSANGDGGALLAWSNSTANGAIHHMHASKSCDDCNITFGAVEHGMAIAATATHYRVESLSPSTGVLNTAHSIAAYASDAEGFVDITVGGLTKCAFAPQYTCGNEVIDLNITASQNGVVLNDFFPEQTYMTRGGPSQPSFSLIKASNFKVTNGATPAAGTSFQVNGSSVSHCIPIVHDDVSNLTSASYATYGFSTEIGLADLYLQNSMPDNDMQVNLPTTITVGFTKQFNATGTARFMASKADNSIKMTWSGTCPFTLLEPTATKKMLNGIVNFTVVFTAKTVGGFCSVVFTNLVGSAACGTSCASTSKLVAYELLATSWDFDRPSAFENDAAGKLGPLYAVGGRTQYVFPQLYEVLPVATKRAMSCRDCVVSVSQVECSPAPTIKPSGGATFNINGTASIGIAWPLLIGTNSTINAYACGLLVTSTGGLDPPASTAFAVTVCNPVRLDAVLNTSSPEWNLGAVTTADAYAFDVRMLDVNDDVCRGDSMYGQSTLLTAELVDGSGSVLNASSASIEVLNVNMTTANVPGQPLPEWNNTVYLAGGRFRFRFVFTRPTPSDGSMPVRVRITGTSASPALTTTIYTPFVQVTTGAKTLRDLTPLPRYVSRSRTYTTTLVATDAVPATYLRHHSLTSVVDTTATIATDMHVRPSFRQVLPVTFSGSTSASGAMTSGAKTRSFSFTGADGVYKVWSVATPDAHTYHTTNASTEVILQTPSTLAFYSIGFRTGAVHSCASSCTLPENAVDTQYDTVGAYEYLNTTQGKTFNVSLYIADAAGFIVHGETGLSVTCNISSPSALTYVSLGFAPALTQRGSLTVPIAPDGYANFSVGLLNQYTPVVNPGATIADEANPALLDSERVTLQCFCVGALCPAVPNAATRTIEVRGFNISNHMRDEVANHRVIKVPTTLARLSAMDVTLFRQELLEVLLAAGITFVDQTNLPDVLKITVCEVSRDWFQFADLRGSVCGPSLNCSAAGNSSTVCPPAVFTCACPDVPNPATNATAYRTNQIEITISLSNAPAFVMTDHGAVVAMYLKMERAIVAAISDTTTSAPVVYGNFVEANKFIKYHIVTDTILTTTVNNAAIRAPPAITPSPNSGSTTTTGNTTAPAAASGLAMMMGSLLALILCVLF
jgi:hypothetical protein